MRHSALTATALALLAGSVARADTVEVTSTTLVTAGQQTRGGVVGQKPDLVTVAPAYEILSISASEVTNPVADDLQIVLSTWGALDLAKRRWNAGADSDFTGDVQMGYLQGRLIGRRLLLRIGREQIAAGAGRMLHLDGGQATVYGPAGLSLSGYAGVPVSQRFATRAGLKSWNPVGGDLAYGGRLGWALALPGYPGRGLELGASANFVEDDGEDVRQEAALDFRFTPIGRLAITGFGAYALEAEALAEANLLATFTATPKLRITADWRHTRPDLLLTQNSIFTVFSDAARDEFGGGVAYELSHDLEVGADYHLQLEPEFAFEGTGSAEVNAKDDGDFIGSEAVARIDWRRGETLAGADVSYLDASENGWLGARLYGRRGFGRFFAAADVLAHQFREKVNGEKLAVTGTLSAGLQIARGFSAVVSGRAGMTPFLEQTFDVMAKLVYNPVYRTREVR